MAKYDVFEVICINDMYDGIYETKTVKYNGFFTNETKKYFVLKHGEALSTAQLLIQRYLNKCEHNTLVIGITATPLHGYNTSDIPKNFIAQMNGIYNLSHENNI